MWDTHWLERFGAAGAAGAIETGSKVKVDIAVDIWQTKFNAQALQRNHSRVSPGHTVYTVHHAEMCSEPDTHPFQRRPLQARTRCSSNAPRRAMSARGCPSDTTTELGTAMLGYRHSWTQESVSTD